MCVFKNCQTITLQEMPETAPLGQLPRSVDVYCESDLVDLVKPGDRVAAIGVYRALGSTTAASLSGMFRSMLIATNITRVSRETGAMSLSPGDVTSIRTIARRNDVFSLLSRSLAPSIYGHKYIKWALALMLLGGRERNLANGTHIRGDINILLVGDPSTAKSQMLRFILSIAPLAINTTGRGSSGVGLTAAVTNDPETGERRLEAGAMVLADRGVVCIDEFDKMSDVDRVAIHEVMEQQTVTIAKAGIQASLNARCSVLAAANPIYGRFDNTLPLQRNVALPDSLLSRFDLVFIVRDRIEEASDSRLASHVLRMHRYQRPGSEGVPVPLNATALSESTEDDRAEDTENDTPVFQKFSPLLHGGAAADSVADGESSGIRVELLTIEFIRKFISYCKSRADPKLSDEARAAIQDLYASFRQRNKDRATVITARSLETVIRISTAHAKCRLSKEVTVADVEIAKEIMTFALYGDAQVRKEEGPRGVGTSSTRTDDRPRDNNDDENSNNENINSTNNNKTKRSRAVTEGDTNNEEDGNNGTNQKRRRQKNNTASTNDNNTSSVAQSNDTTNIPDEDEDPQLNEQDLPNDDYENVRNILSATAANDGYPNDDDEDMNQERALFSQSQPVQASTLSSFALRPILASFFQQKNLMSASENEIISWILEHGGEAVRASGTDGVRAALRTLAEEGAILLEGGDVHNLAG
jgi:DNA replication licensing factor MCM3